MIAVFAAPRCTCDFFLKQRIVFYVVDNNVVVFCFLFSGFIGDLASEIKKNCT